MKNNNTKPFYNTTIPDDWDVKKLMNTADYVDYRGKTPKKTTTGRFLVTAKNIKSGYIDYGISQEFISENDYDIVMRRGFPEKGDVLITTEAPLGSVAMIDRDDVALAQRVIKYRAKCNVATNKFLLQYLLSDIFQQILDKNSTGSTAKGIKGSILHKLPVILPPLPEQKAIAKALSLMDTVINKNNQLIAQKELRKKWLMQNLLTGKKRLKGFSGEWKEYSYGKLLKVVKRQVDWDDNELYKLISVRRRSGGIFFREALYGYRIKVKDLRDVEVGDFLFSKMQIVHGASAMVTKEFEGAKISGSYIATIAKDSKVLNMLYFNWFSKLLYFYHQTLISSYGVHIEKMTFDFKLFLKETIKLPEIKEQIAITNVLQAVDKEIELLKAKTDKLKEQKKGMMQVLLTGKKRLKVD